MHGAVQSSHVGALVKWPRNDELRIMKATRMAQKIFHAYLKAKDCPFHRYWGAMSCIRNRNFSRSFPFTRFHLLVTMTYVHPLVPGYETELLSRPSALDILSGLLTSKMKPKYSTCSLFRVHFNFISAHGLKALEILFPRIQTSERCRHTKLQMPDGKAIVPRSNCGYISRNNDYYRATTTSQGLQQRARRDGSRV
jgi:hypothetical protein